MILKRLALLMMLLTSLVLMSCGGGGGGGEIRDLSGLEGVWNYPGTFQGTIDGEPFSFTDTLVFTVSRTSVVDQDGDAWTWSYDGSTLNLSFAQNLVGFDIDCGDMTLNGTANLNWDVSPGETIASVSGNMTPLTITSEFCGNATGGGNWTGTVSKI